MRWNEQWKERARACASVVLPTPGTSSISRWPRASSVGERELDDVVLALHDAGDRAQKFGEALLAFAWSLNRVVVC